MATNQGIKATKEERELVESFMGYTDGYLSQWVDWNDLMKIVEKIREFNCVIAFEICFSLGVIVKVRYNDKWHIYEGNEAIEIVYSAVLDFVKWYN